MVGFGKDELAVESIVMVLDPQQNRWRHKEEWNLQNSFCYTFSGFGI